MKARLLDLGGTPMPLTPADFGWFIANDIEKWAKVIKFANINRSDPALIFHNVPLGERRQWCYWHSTPWRHP